MKAEHHRKIWTGVGIVVAVVQVAALFGTLYTVSTKIEQINSDRYYRTEALIYQRKVDAEIQFIKDSIEFIKADLENISNGRGTEEND